jgi:UDPglucose 6-dehydrogenase
MADLCEALGGNIKQLSNAIGLDSRIGEKFLNPGPGFGGSCFPKDIMAILNAAKETQVELSLIDAVVSSNLKRQNKMVAKISAALNGKIAGKKIALLGLAFKANTDDIRYSPAINLAKNLAQKGAQILAHDFAAIANAKIELADFKNIEFCADAFQAVAQVDLIVIATEWKQYRELDFSQSVCRKIVDLRNLLDGEKLKTHGFEYFFIGGKS